MIGVVFGQRYTATSVINGGAVCGIRFRTGVLSWRTWFANRPLTKYRPVLGRTRRCQHRGWICWGSPSIPHGHSADAGWLLSPSPRRRGLVKRTRRYLLRRQLPRFPRQQASRRLEFDSRDSPSGAVRGACWSFNL